MKLQPLTFWISVGQNELEKQREIWSQGTWASVFNLLRLIGMFLNSSEPQFSTFKTGMMLIISISQDCWAN